MVPRSHRAPRQGKPTPTQPTRIAADVFAAAQHVGSQESRSAAQQIDHWVRVGQSVALQHTASRRRVDAVLAGTLPMTALRPEERIVVHAELDTAIAERAAGTSLGQTAADRGVTTVALDDRGRLGEYRPDGTSAVLDPPPVDGAALA